MSLNNSMKRVAFIENLMDLTDLTLIKFPDTLQSPLSHNISFVRKNSNNSMTL